MFRAMAGTALVLWSLVAGNAGAQQQRFFYPEPPPEAVSTMRDVRFATVGTTALAMDIYRSGKTSVASPALIFYLTFDPGRQTPRQSNEWIKSWARIAAANGIVGIIPDLRDEAHLDDFRRVVAHLTEHAIEYGIDRERLAVFSASGPVAQAFPAVEDPRQTAIKAAVMYYGRADVTTFRLDLPILYVRAGLDHPGMNAEIVKLAALAASQNAPVTLINHHTGHHAFETVDDDAATRQVIEQTIEFVKRATAPAFQAAVRAGQLDAVAAGHSSTGNFHEAALTLAELMKRRPADGLLGFRYAEALLADKQYRAACIEFRRPTSPSFAAIEPGTRACVLAGSIDTAVVWLQSFRKDWLKSEYLGSLRADSVFAPLWGRADFRALFP